MHPEETKPKINSSVKTRLISIRKSIIVRGPYYTMDVDDYKCL